MKLSVIIPTLNEAWCIAGTIQSLRAQDPCEIIVVDGGSSDGTQELARDADKVLSSSPGRAGQMNTGASQSHGDVLLFLHADCRLEDDWPESVARSLAKRGVIAGCFSMCAAADGVLYRTIDGCATARVRCTGLAYGDQGLFMRSADFKRLGGFPPLRFMEDLFFSRTLRRHGRVDVVRSKIFVSARRWQKSGLFRQTLRNWTLTVLAAAGVHPDRLARFYDVIR